MFRQHCTVISSKTNVFHNRKQTVCQRPPPCEMKTPSTNANLSRAYTELSTTYI